MDDLSLYRFRIGCFASIAYKQCSKSRKRKHTNKIRFTVKCRRKRKKTSTAVQKNTKNEKKRSCRLALLILVIILIPVTSLNNKHRGLDSFQTFSDYCIGTDVPNRNENFFDNCISMHQNETNYTRNAIKNSGITLLIDSHKEHWNAKQTLNNVSVILENKDTYFVNDLLTDTDMSFLNTTLHIANVSFVDGNMEWPQNNKSLKSDLLCTNAVSMIIMLLIGTCYYLLGNKGAHCYNGNPTEKPGDAWLTTSTLSLIKARVDESVGYISTKSTIPQDGDVDITYTDTGTGFRAGDKYFITAYHVYKEKIDQTLMDLCLRFEDLNVLDPVLTRLCEALNIKKEQKGISTGDVHKMLKLFTQQTATNIPKLLNLLDGIRDVDKIDEWFSKRQKNKCLVSFLRHGDFYVDWKIAFGDEQSDIIIVQLLESLPGQTFPRPLLLDENYRQLKDIHILRYIKENTSKVLIDQDTYVFDDDNAFKKQVDDAIEWWNNTFPGENDTYFSDFYASCKTRYDDRTGRVIFKASKAFQHGASGSPIVYLFNSDGQPVVGMIYQRGLPEFYYCAQNPTEKQYMRFKGIQIDSTKCLFESGTTMKRLAELMEKAGQNDLKCNIFSQPLIPQYNKLSIQEIQHTTKQIKKEVLGLRAEMRKAIDPRCRVNPNINKLNNMITQSREQLKYETSVTSNEPRYVKTGAYHAAEQILKNSNIIVITGNPGDGKTALAYQLMRSLTQNQNDNSLQPLILPDVNLFDDLIEPDNALCVLLDDMLGSCCAELNKYSFWNSRLGMLLSTFKHGNNSQGNILIVTTRTDVLNDCPLSVRNSPVFSKKNTIDMSSKCYLNNECMLDILKTYLPVFAENIGDELLEKLKRYSPTFGFPQCCKLMGSMDQTTLKPEEILQNPMKFLWIELEKLEEQLREKSDGKFKYYSLLILLLHPTYFTTDTHSQTEREILDCLQRIYGLKWEGKEKITHTLQGMRGVYVECDAKAEKFYFSHESVHTAVAFAFGSKFTKYFIKFCHSQLLSSLVIDEESNPSNGNIKVPTHDLPYLQRRIIDLLVTKDEKTFKNVAGMPVWMNHMFMANMMQMDKSPLSMFHTDTTGRSMLVYLVEKGRTSVVQKIISNNNDHCETQLKLAINAACINGHYDIFGILFNTYAYPDIHFMANAVKGRNTQILSFLLDKFPTLGYQKLSAQLHSFRDFRGITILHQACFEGNIDMVNLICSQLPDLALIPDDSGMTPLHVSCFEGHLEVTEYLVDKYPKLLHEKYDGCLPIHEAAESGNILCFDLIERFIMKDYPDIKPYVTAAVTDDDLTIFNAACQSGKEEMCRHIYTKYPYLLHQKNTLSPILSLACSGDVNCFKNICKLCILSDEKEERCRMITSENYEGHNILHYACVRGRTEMCRYIVKTYPSLINVKNYFGNFVHYTALSENIECLKLMTDIIVENKDPEYRKQYMMECLNEVGSTILHLACFKGNTEVCQYIVDNYSDLIHVKTNNGVGVLHTAAFSGNIECLKYMTDLVVENKDPEYRKQYMMEYLDKSGCTLLHAACQSSNTMMCQYIVENYPNLIQVLDNDGKGVLHATAESGNVECLKHMTDIVVKNKDPEYRKQYMIKYLDKVGCSILHLACSEGRTKMCQYITNNYPNLVNVKTNDGDGVLHTAALSGNIECLKHMTDIVVKSKDPEFRKQYMMECLDKSGCTILHIACRGGKTDICRYIIDNYPNLVYVKDKDGEGILHAAAFSGNIECLKHMTDIVIENKDPEYRKQYMMEYLNESGCTILQLACHEGETEMCQYIANHYPNLVNVKSNDGKGVLHATASSGNIECLKYMTDIVVENKDPEYRKQYMMEYLNESGYTILQLACREGETEMCQYITNNYPNLVNVKTNNGLSVLHTAALSGNIECLKHMTDIVIESKDPEFRKQYMMECLDKSGWTILRVACLGGKTGICRYIIDNYPNLVNVKDKDGKGVLHATASSGNIECLKHMTDIVVENKDPEYRKQYMMGYLDKSGFTILQLACCEGETKMCQYIANNYPNLVNVKSNDGKGVLHAAASSGNIECLKHMTDIVVENKDPEFRKQYMMECLDESCCTILHLACLGGKTEICQYIANNYPNLVNVKNKYGEGVLHATASSGIIECLKHMTDIVVKNKDPEYRKQCMMKYLNKSGGTILDTACCDGNTEMCQYIFDTYPDLVNVKPKDGKGVLHAAAFSGNIECLKHMTDIVVENKDPEYRKQYMIKYLSKYGFTILLLACASGETEICQYIANNYPNLVDVKDYNGRGILHVSVLSSNIECLKHMTDILIENKDPEYRKQYMMGYLDKAGSTILHLACRYGETEICQYIVDNYPNLVHVNDNDGYGVVHYTALSGNIECLKYMTDIVVENKDPEYRKQYMMRYLDKSGRTILHSACLSGETDICRYIVDNYPNLVNVKRNNRQGVLHETALSGNIECLKYMTDIVVENKDPEYRKQYMMRYLDKSGHTILHLACRSGETDICRYIVDNYPNLVNVKRNDRHGVLHETAFSGNIECLKYMTDIVVENKDPAYRKQYMMRYLDKSGRTILHLACRSGETDICRYIVDNYPNLVNVKRNDRHGVLHETAFSGNIECLKYMTDIVVENKDLEYRKQYMMRYLDKAGNSILHLACRGGKPGICQYILENYPNLVNVNRKYLHRLLCEQGVSEDIGYLKEIVDKKGRKCLIM